MSIQNQDISKADADAYHAIVAGENAFISTPSEPLDGQAIVGFIQATEVLERFSCSNAGNFLLFELKAFYLFTMMVGC